MPYSASWQVQQYFYRHRKEAAMVSVTRRSSTDLGGENLAASVASPLHLRCISAEGMADNWIKAFHGPAKMKEGQFVPPEAYRLSTKPRPGYRKITMDRRVTLKTDSLSRCVGEKQVTMKEVFHTGSEIGNLPPGSRGIWFHICSAQDKDKSPYKTHVSKIQALLDGKGGNPKCRISYYSLNDVIGSYRRTLDISEVEFRIYGTTSSDMGFVYTVMVCPKACHEMDQKRFPVMKVGKCYDNIEIVKEESREDKYHLEWTPYSTDSNWMRDHLTFLFYVPVQEDEPLHYFRYQKMKSGKEREFPMDKLPAQQDLPAPKHEPLSPQYSPPSPQLAPSVSYFDTPPPSPSSPTYKPSPVHYKLVDPLQPEAPSEYLSDFTRRKLRSHSDLDRLRLEKAVNSPNHYSNSLVQSDNDSSGASDSHKNSPALSDDDSSDASDSRNNSPAQSDNDSSDASDSHNNSPAQSDNDSSGTYDSCSNSPVKLEAKLSCKENVHDPEFDGIDKKGVRALSRDLAKQYFGKKVLTEASLNRKDYNHLDDDHDYMKRIQKEVVRNFASNGNEEDIIRLCRKAISTYCSYLRSRTAAAYSDDEPLDKFPAKPKARVSKSGCKSPKDQEYNINTNSVSAMSRDLAKHYFGEKVLAKSSLNRGDYNHLDDYDDMKRIQDMVVRKFASNGNDEDIIRLCRKSIATYCSNLRK